MGTWGFGPFDSDGALDFLGDLAMVHARTADDGSVLPGSVDAAGIAVALRVALQAVTRAPEEPVVPGFDEENAYAAAGLVAAALSTAVPAESRGTRLLGDAGSGPGDVLGLGAHCGFVALLPHAVARRLLPYAIAAVDALTTPTAPGTAAWLRAEHRSTALAHLRATLELHQQVTCS